MVFVLDTFQQLGYGPSMIFACHFLGDEREHSHQDGLFDSKLFVHSHANWMSTNEQSRQVERRKATGLFEF